MSRVKFNVNTEYAYLQNFKILQSMYHEGLIYPCKASSHLSHKTLSRNTKSSAPSLLSPWSNARCKIISNFSNGPSVTGTNTIRVATTMLFLAGKEPEALHQLLPQHRSLLVPLVLAPALLALLDVVLPQQRQQPQRRAEQDQLREVHPQLCWRKIRSSNRPSRGWRGNETSISAN